ALHRPLRAAFGFARIALYLRIEHFAALAFGHGRLEPSARLCGYWVQCYRRLLSLRESVAARRHWSHFLGCVARVAGHRCFDLDRISRREDFSAPHAVD